jgi:tetratricopeptide (TPR) repeat protein
MRVQLPTIIFLCISLIIIIPLIYYMKTSNQAPSREAINLESEEFKSLREQGSVAHNAHKYEQAIKIFEEALRMRPENAEVHNDLAATCYEFGLEQAGPSWPSWEANLAGRTPTEALQEFQRAIDTVVSGYIVFKSDKPEVTQAIEKKAREIDAYLYTERFGDNATMNIVIGKTKALFMKAIEGYLRAIDIKPAYSPAYRNLGSLYMKIGRYDTAIDYLEKALELDPRDEDLQEYLNQLRSDNTPIIPTTQP